LRSRDVAALITGGKDSALALYEAMNAGYHVKYLVTMLPERQDSWMFHYPNIRLAKLFAEAVGIPYIEAKTSGIKEKELEDLKKVLQSLEISGVVSGAIASKYQKSRIDRICRELSIESITPLWNRDQVKILRDLVTLGFDVIIVGVYAYGLGLSWLGRRIDERAINDLMDLNAKFKISPVGEGGEYETFVLDAPYFKKRIEILDFEIRWDGESGHMEIKRAKLVPKK